jgi:hypothetical protein
MYRKPSSQKDRQSLTSLMSAAIRLQPSRQQTRGALGVLFGNPSDDTIPLSGH